MKTKTWLVIFISICSTCFAESIVSSKHNLSVSGPGEIKSIQEKEICIFCHAPHNASSEAPLWNHFDSGQTYIPYTSSTTKASIGQPTGASKLCLSCHDGTVALGMVYSRESEIPFIAGLGVLPEGDSNLEIALTDDHPISFPYDAALVASNPELNNPALLNNEVKLDRNDQLQCTSCHDPHNDENGKFLVMNNARSALCLQCHNKNGWDTTVHNLSSKTWDGISADPWPHTDKVTVSENGCENCHRPHGAGSQERLLNYAPEENNCFVCHNGHVAQKDIQSEFNKKSIHPVMDSIGVHDPAESLQEGFARHVECSDCHNQHAVNDQDSHDLPGSLRLVKGVNANGIEVATVNYEYEICFRCHSSSHGSKTYVNRQYPEMNTLLEFSSVNASYHPVITIGKNPDVPSLISPYTTSSIIQCSSCHNNDTGPNNSGTGPNGPHGSQYPPLLERQLLFSDQLPESYNTYAMCYKCHDRTKILAGTSFPEHSNHIVNENIGCMTCHDPHGVKDSSHLINFDRSIVQPSSSGKLYFQDDGRFRGRCYLKCHGENHSPKRY